MNIYKKRVGRWLFVFLTGVIFSTPQLFAEENTLKATSAGSSFTFKLENTKIVLNKDGKIEIWENRKSPTATVTGDYVFTWNSPLSSVADHEKNRIRMITSKNQILIKGLIDKENNYSIVNMSGKTIDQGKNASCINISTLTKGVYIVRVNNLHTFKFVKL